MDMKGSITAIKDAITKSAAERTSPEVISAAYAVVYLIGGVLLASARLLGAAGPFGMAAVAASGAGLNGVAALIGAAIGYIISCGLAGSIRYLAAFDIDVDKRELHASFCCLFSKGAADTGGRTGDCSNFIFEFFHVCYPFSNRLF